MLEGMFWDTMGSRLGRRENKGEIISEVCKVCKVCVSLGTRLGVCVLVVLRGGCRVHVFCETHRKNMHTNNKHLTLTHSRAKK